MLTPVELKIIECLRQDPRCTVSKIAEVAGIPASTARSRLNKLLRDQTVELGVSVNSPQLKHYQWVMVGIQTTVGDMEVIAAILSKRPEIYFVGATTGLYNIMIGIMVANNDILFDFLTKTLAKIPGVQSTYTFNVLNVFKRSFIFDLPTEVLRGDKPE